MDAKGLRSAPPPPQTPTGVRPYRSLISAQAIYRREVFQ